MCSMLNLTNVESCWMEILHQFARKTISRPANTHNRPTGKAQGILKTVAVRAVNEVQPFLNCTSIRKRPEDYLAY